MLLLNREIRVTNSKNGQLFRLTSTSKMIYRSLLFSLWLIFLCQLINAQSYDLHQKQPGSIVMENNDSLVGEIVLGSNWQSVTLISERSMQQVYAKQVKKVRISEGYGNKEFLSLQTHEKGDFFFFEVLVFGEIKLLCSSGLISLKDSKDRKYYILDEGYALKIAKSDKSLFSVFGKYKKEMKDYAFSMAMNLEMERDLKLLFDYFNQNYSDEI
jgi:hypothetical protein